MDQIEKKPILFVHLLEYHKLKDEQVRRIDYRDRLVDVHLVVVGAAIGWALTHHAYHVFLVIPWVCLILGWAYLVNDDRVGAIGEYIRIHLTPLLREVVGQSDAGLFSWEIIHRTDKHRTERKVWQFVVDLIEFVFSGFLALGLFVWFESGANFGIWLLVAAEAVMLLLLGAQFFRYGDFARGD